MEYLGHLIDEFGLHYDARKKLVVACDASPNGLGPVLSHEMDDGSEHPICFASRSLTPAEKKYSQLDKEALAIVFGVTRFHQYLYGRNFTLLTDHKPLVHLFNPTHSIPQMAASRIQRWNLTLSAYSYTIRFKPGKDNSNADALSRLPLPTSLETIPVPGDILLSLQTLATTPVNAVQIKNWTARDPLLSKVKTVRSTRMSNYPSRC